MAKTLEQNFIEQHGPILGRSVYAAFLADQRGQAAKVAEIQAQIAVLRGKKLTAERSHVEFLANAAASVEQAYQVWSALATSFERLRNLAQSECGQWDGEIATLIASMHQPPSWQRVEDWKLVPDMPSLPDPAAHPMPHANEPHSATSWRQ